MDWEQKFTSIIGETEANLHRVKEKLHGRHIVGSAGNKSFDSQFYSGRGYQPVDRPSVSMIQYPVSSTPKAIRWDNSHNMDNRLSQYEGVETFALSSRLDQQNRTIDQLNNLVRVMEKERDEHKQQISELKFEIRELSKHVTDNNKEESLQRQITLLKTEILKEVETIRDQVHIYKTRHDTSHKHHNIDDSSRSYSKDLANLRDVIRDELEYVRTDLEVIRHRLSIVEGQMLSNKGDSQTSRLYKVMDRVSDNRKLLSETRDTIPTTLTSRSVDKYEMNSLRSNVSALKDKLDRVEEKLQQSLTQPYTSTLFPTTKPAVSSVISSYKNKSYQFQSCHLDDLELSDDKFEDSDDLESDLDDLEEDGGPSHKRKSFNQKTVEELDLELMKFEDKHDDDDDDDLYGDDDLDNILSDI